MNISYRSDFHLYPFPPGNAVEIGVAEGRYSDEILSWAIFPCVYLVDRWLSVPTQSGDASAPQEWHDANLAIVMQRLTKYPADRWTILRGESTNMASHVPDSTLAFVYIDCDHSYDGVRRDIVAWYPKLASRGVIAFHDYAMPQYGTRQAVREFSRSANLRVYFIPENRAEDAGAYIIKP